MNSALRLPRLHLLTQLLVCLLVTGRALANAGDEVSYNVNGCRATYDLALVRGHFRASPPATWNLKPGATKTIFVALLDASLVSEHRLMLTATIGRLRSRISALEQLTAEARPGGEAEHMFFPKTMPTDISFAFVGGRRWLISTKFGDQNKQFVKTQVYWGLEGGLIMTFNINFNESAPRDVKWRQRRLETLRELVSTFRVAKPQR